MVFDPGLTMTLFITAVLSAFVGLLMLAVLQKKIAPQTESVFLDHGYSADYLFDGETLIDATPAARNLLPKGGQRGTSPWPRLLCYLEKNFPGATERVASLQKDGSMMMSSIEGVEPPLLLKAEWRGGLTRISLLDPDASNQTAGTDPLTRRAIGEELDQLRATAAQAPMPIWRETRGGDVVWANARYLELVAERIEEGEDLVWPLPRLFEKTASAQGAKSQRQKLGKADGTGAYWFELSGHDEPDGRLIFAMPADAVIQAEDSLRAFMQTLTKTFAHLSTGLAIFDESRRLVLFNPALIDLTGLPPELLSARPSLVSFFDAMRDRSMIPEPRDYRSWRNQITDLEKAASSGLFEETWSLPGGQTHHVTGRPHPNGALALSFEDISTEMSQTRRYRADLELGQAVIDAMDEAIAVFSSAGVLVMSNTAYSDLWDHDPAASLSGDSGIVSVCDHWRGQSAPSSIWDRAEDFATTTGGREAWSDKTRLSDGRLLSCRFSRLAGSATLAAFRVLDQNEGEVALTFNSNRKIA